MNKEFIPYEQALALKELGFDEPCFGAYYIGKVMKGDGIWIFDKKLMGELIIHDFIKKISDNSALFKPNYIKNSNNSYYVSAPLYQQAFRWFYWKHHIKAEPLNFIGDKCTYRIHNGDYNTPLFYIPEEAELECLRKLIEIVKNK